MVTFWKVSMKTPKTEENKNLKQTPPVLRLVHRGPDPPPTGEIRILMIDAHELFVEGIRRLIENEPGMAIIGHASDRMAALEAARMGPDIILLELRLRDEDTIDFLPDLIRIAEGARILIVTGETDPDLQIRAVRQGAVGVLPKTEPASSLFKAIHKIHSGEVWLRRSLMTSVMTGLFKEEASKPRDPEAPKIASLTPREIEVVALIGEGLRNKQIGERLFISETTVRHYLTSIFDKLGVADRLELMVYAYQHGLARIAPPGRS